MMVLSLTPSLAQSHEMELQDPAAIFQILSGINTARIANDLTPYALNPLLTQAAQIHSEYQRDIGQVTHDGPDGTRAINRVLAVGYPAARANENIYAGMVGPRQALNWWLGSTAGHSQNILHQSMREIGVGAASSSDGVTYFTVVFSAQPNVLPIFVNNDAYSTNTAAVTLSLTNEDVFGGSAGEIGHATQVLISNTPDFTNAASHPWSQFISWTLDTSSGVGLKTVYVRFIDVVGNTADSQDSIVLDTGDGDVVAPTAMPTLPLQTTAVPQQAVTPISQPTNAPTPTPTIAFVDPLTVEMTQVTATPTMRGSLMRITSTMISVVPTIQPASGAPAGTLRTILSGTLGLGLVCIVIGSFNLLRLRHSEPEPQEGKSDATED
ncbi:MAG: CAP domain-containing protein [Anaerolineae bacterium]|nr:CAP domain-containing protein [Anaerolineae bacterium]